jgi:hypothetical protein
MGYFDVYGMLLGLVLLFLMLLPFVPALRRIMLDHREDPPLDLEPFEFYIEMLDIMDEPIKRNDFLAAVGLAFIYLFSIVIAMIPSAMMLLLWPVMVLVLVLAVPFYLFIKLSEKSKKDEILDK